MHAVRQTIGVRDVRDAGAMASEAVTTDSGGPRVAGRVVLVHGPTGRLLLQLHGWPHRPFWACPGGGVEDGESPREAAGRELTEETGRRDEPGEELFTWEHVLVFAAEPVRQHESYFLASTDDDHVPAQAPDTADGIVRRVWTAPEDIGALVEPVWPPDLAARVADVVRRVHLDAVLVGGREPAAIRVVDYDPSWPVTYRALEARVRGALGEAALEVEHIGSTSVPGLAAKPIIDALLVVADVEDEDAYVPALVDAGLVLRVREPGHRMLRTPARDVHLHVYAPGRPETQAYLDLRDWLRVDEADRALYERTKCDLAGRSWEDMNDYADAKSDVIAAVLARARAWRTGSSSTTTG